MSQKKSGNDTISIDATALCQSGGSRDIIDAKAIAAQTRKPFDKRLQLRPVDVMIYSPQADGLFGFDERHIAFAHAHASANCIKSESYPHGSKAVTTRMGFRFISNKYHQ